MKNYEEFRDKIIERMSKVEIDPEGKKLRQITIMYLQNILPGNDAQIENLVLSMTDALFAEGVNKGVRLGMKLFLEEAILGKSQL